MNFKILLESTLVDQHNLIISTELACFVLIYFDEIFRLVCLEYMNVKLSILKFTVQILLMAQLKHSNSIKT